MKKSELKQLIREVITENLEAPISPQVKQVMLKRLNDAAAMVKKANNMQELASLGGAEYDEQNGTFSVQIYNNRTDR